MKRTDLIYRKENTKFTEVKELTNNEMHELRGGGNNNTNDPKEYE